MINQDENGFLILGKNTVQLKPYIPRPFKQYPLMSDAELYEGAGGYLIVDSELHPNFYFIGLKNVTTGKVYKLEAPFSPQHLSWILHNYTTIGFNSIKFDLPLMWLYYYTQNVELVKEAANAIILGGMWISDLKKQYNFEIFPTPHIDLIEVCPLRGSLKLYMARLHAKRIQELPIDHMKHLTPKEKLIVGDYCINDLDGTHLLLDNLKEQLKLRADLSIEYKQDLMSKSDAQIAEAVIGSELKRLTGKWPAKPKIEGTTHKFNVPSNMFFQTKQLQDVLAQIAEMNFIVNENGRLDKDSPIKKIKIQIGNSIYRMGIGGLHSSEENAAVKSDENYQLIDTDVASYYPLIVLNLKLFPKHLGPAFLEVYQSLVNRRLEAKKAKNIAISECIKITINGTFGKTGSPFSILYAPEVTIAITIGGQLYLLMLIEALELSGISVVSANTDGILVKCERDKIGLMGSIVDMWEQHTGFVTEEGKYAAIYSRDVNAYLAIKEPNEKGEVKVKGKNVYYDPWRPETARDGYWRFQKNPNAQICVEAIEKLIISNKPLVDTIKECREFTKFVSVKNVTGGAHKDGNYLGKVVRWYYAKNISGTINYVSSGNKVPDTEGAKECMDLPDKFPDDIEFSWYENKCMEMLKDMGYYAREKQLKFW